MRPLTASARAMAVSTSSRDETSPLHTSSARPSASRLAYSEKEITGRWLAEGGRERHASGGGEARERGMDHLDGPHQAFRLRCARQLRERRWRLARLGRGGERLERALDALAHLPQVS